MAQCAYMTDYMDIHDLQQPVLDTHHHTLIHTRIFTVQCAYKDDYMHKKYTVFVFTHRLSLSSYKHTHTASSDVLQCSSLCLSSKTNQTQLREAAITRPMNQ